MTSSSFGRFRALAGVGGSGKPSCVLALGGRDRLGVTEGDTGEDAEQVLLEQPCEASC